MQLKQTIEKLGVVKVIATLLIMVLLIVFVFREQIKESKYTKAKLEIFDRMKDSKLKDWPSEISNVIDSMILENQDTLNSGN